MQKLLRSEWTWLGMAMVLMALFGMAQSAHAGEGEILGLSWWDVVLYLAKFGGVEGQLMLAATGLTALVGGASMVVKGLEKIAKITPSTADDQFASSAAKVVGKATKLLDKIALNPKRD